MGTYEKLSKWIVAGFPTSTTSNMMDTMSMQVLERLSSSLLSAEYPSVADTPPNLLASGRKVEFSFKILKALQENADSTLTGGNTSPVRRKKGRTAASNPHIDPLPFDSLGISVPTTDAEVRDVHGKILSQLRNILEVCGSTTDSLSVELSRPRTISSFSGSQRFRIFSNPHTSR